MTDDTWSGGWEDNDEPDREEVLRLARQLADQRARQRAEDLAELEELKRALRERAGEVAAREAEVERAWAQVHGRDETPESARRRSLRLRRERPPANEDEHAYAEELLARREADVEQRTAALVARERELRELETSIGERTKELEREKQEAQRDHDDLEALRAEASRTGDEIAARAASAEAAEQELNAERERVNAFEHEIAQREHALAERERAVADRGRVSPVPEQHGREQRDAEREHELRRLESRLAGREAEVTRLQALLAAREEELRRREREFADAERLRERAAAVPVEPYLSFSEGLDALAGRSQRGWPSTS
jgi:chromosome segregation ATPase